MDEKFKKRLKQIKTENIFLGIFIILIFLAYTANNIEIDYFLNNNLRSKNEYYNMMIFIFLIVVIISGYYFYQNYQEITSKKNQQQNQKEKEYQYLDLIASGSALFASLIYLYIAITDTNIEAEISL